MSGKKPSLLRSALKEMRVNEPVRLSKSAPAFRPPAETRAAASNVEAPPREVPLSEPPRTEGPQKQLAQSELSQKEAARNEVAQSEVTLNKAPQSELPHNEESRSERARREVAQNEAAKSEVTRNEQPRPEPPRNEGARKEHPQVESPQNEVAQSQVTQNEASPAEAAQNGLPHSEPPRKKKAKHGVPQNEGPSSVVGVQNELPQIEQPSRAFFRLSDRAFSYPQLQVLSGDCFRLFLWMSSRGWRYQNSDGTLRASVSFIEDHTAMSHATISRCLKTLREARLIDLLETDYKRGNVWSISPLAFGGCDPENLPPRSGGPQNEAPRKGAAAASKRDRSSLNLRDKPPQIEGQIRNIYKSKKLSQEGAQPLHDLIESIRAPEKQKTEREGLMQLLETHEPEELQTALAYVEKYGTLSGESCHSPFRYLAVAVDDVLQACRRKGIDPTNKSDGGRSESSAKLAADEERNAELNRVAFAAFESDLTQAERDGFIARYVEKEFTWGYKPAEPLLTKLAAFEWYQEKLATQPEMASCA